jgi:hypothetical protein
VSKPGYAGPLMMDSSGDWMGRIVALSGA